jgi:hypothetical protein
LWPKFVVALKKATTKKNIKKEKTILKVILHKVMTDRNPRRPPDWLLIDICLVLFRTIHLAK